MNEKQKKKISESLSKNHRLKGKHRSKETKLKISASKKGKPSNRKGCKLSKKTRELMSKIQCEQYLIGKHRYKKNSKNGYYGKEYYESSWELEYMKYLDKNDLLWTKKHRIVIPYEYEGIKYNYIPDFLVDNVNIVEIKPSFKFKEEKTVVKLLSAKKWCNENGFVFSVLTEGELNNLGVLVQV